MSNRRTVVASGRLASEKGFDALLRSHANCSLPRKDWQLVILGDSPEHTSLNKQVLDLGLKDSVLMPGAVREPQVWLQHSDLFVLPTRYKGFPNALLEAMRCGLAAAAFDCPSGPDEMHEQTGLLWPSATPTCFQPASPPSSVTKNLRQRFGSAAASDVASHFSLNRVGSMWEDLWNELLTTTSLTPGLADQQVHLLLQNCLQTYKCD